jgi:hypothetical protein
MIFVNDDLTINKGFFGAKNETIEPQRIILILWQEQRGIIYLDKYDTLHKDAIKGIFCLN